MEDVFGGLEVVPSPVEWLGALVVAKADVYEQLLEVGMLEAILDRVSLLRVEHQHLLEQTVSVRICLWEDLLEDLLVAFWQFSDVFAGKLVSDEGHVIVGGGS